MLIPKHLRFMERDRDSAVVKHANRAAVSTYGTRVLNNGSDITTRSEALSAARV